MTPEDKAELQRRQQDRKELARMAPQIAKGFQKLRSSKSKLEQKIREGRDMDQLDDPKLSVAEEHLEAKRLIEAEISLDKKLAEVPPGHVIPLTEDEAKVHKKRQGVVVEETTLNGVNRLPLKNGVPIRDEGINDGVSGTWYELPPGATELKHLIWFKDMNAQVGEIFRSCYRMNDCPHSDRVRNLNKIIAYAEQEKERIALYEEE